MQVRQCRIPRQIVRISESTPQAASPRRPHHRQDARPDRRGQVGPCRDHRRKLGVGGRRRRRVWVRITGKCAAFCAAFAGTLSIRRVFRGSSNPAAPIPHFLLGHTRRYIPPKPQGCGGRAIPRLRRRHRSGARVSPEPPQPHSLRRCPPQDSVDLPGRARSDGPKPARSPRPSSNAMSPPLQPAGETPGRSKRSSSPAVCSGSGRQTSPDRARSCGGGSRTVLTVPSPATANRVQPRQSERCQHRG